MTFQREPAGPSDLLSVSIELDIGPDEVEEYLRDYLRVVNMNELARIYRDTKGKLGLFLDFYNEFICIT